MGCFGMTTGGADDGVADGRAFGGVGGLFPRPRRWNSGVDDEEALGMRGANLRGKSWVKIFFAAGFTTLRLELDDASLRGAEGLDVNVVWRSSRCKEFVCTGCSVRANKRNK